MLNLSAARFCKFYTWSWRKYYFLWFWGLFASYVHSCFLDYTDGNQVTKRAEERSGLKNKQDKEKPNNS